MRPLGLARGRWWLAAAVSVACLVGPGQQAVAGAGTGAGTRPGTGASSSRAGSGGSSSAAIVTLVTGDRVQVVTRAGGRQDASLIRDAVDRRPGGYVLRRGKDLYVVPAEAVAYLRAGKLDPALFNVTRLVADGLGDTTAPAMRLLVTAPSSPLTSSSVGLSSVGSAAQSSPRAAGTAPAPPPDSTATARVPSLGLTGVKVAKTEARTFWEAIDTTTATPSTGRAAAAGGAGGPGFAHGVGKLWLDRRVHTGLDRSVPQIGAPAAHALGLTGKGVTVGIVDTGIDNENPDVAPQVVREKNFTTEDTTDDPSGHGTHVASIVAGSGKQSGGRYKGVAPDARLLDARVLDSTGYGNESDVLAGMEWAAQQGAQVVNLSLDGPPTDGTDPMSAAVNTLSATYGSLFVVAAGNSGAAESVGTPGAAEAALTVGAVDRSDVLADFSSRGPRVGDGAVKPEITAPGVDIVAAQADGTALGPVAAPGYVALSGTSMAAPHVAGAAALVRQQHPDWTPRQVKSGLVATATPSAGTPVWHQGVGRVNLSTAIAAGGLAVDSGTLDLGFFSWPHGRHPVVTRRLTYTNHGSTGTTVNLTTTLTDDNGTALTGTALAFDTTRLSLAPGASAVVTLTFDPNKAGVGRWGGLVTATPSTGVTLRTAVGFINESERYDVTVNVLDRQGRPTAAGLVMLTDARTGEEVVNWDLPDPTRPTFRIPPGTWSAAAAHADFTSRPGTAVMAIDPQVTVSKDTALTLDFRKARPSGLSVGDAGVSSVASSMCYSRALDGWGGICLMGDSVTHYVTPTARVTVGQLSLTRQASLRVPELAARLVSPTTAPLHPTLMVDDNRLDGRRTLSVAEAEAEAEAEAGGAVAGRLALLGVDGPGPVDEAVASLAKAGAVAVAVYPTGPDGAAWVDGTSAVPVLWLEQDEGRTVKDRLAAGPVRVELVGQYYTPRSYELAKAWQGQIPQQATARYTPRELARVQETYRSVGDATRAYETITAADIGGVFVGMPVKIGGERTVFVSPEFRWAGYLSYGRKFDAGIGGFRPVVSWEQPPTTYQVGRPARQAWLTGVMRPAQPVADVSGSTRRSGDDLSVEISPLTDGNGWRSRLGQDDGVWELTSGGTRLAAGTGSMITATLPAARRTYTLTYGRSMPQDPIWQRSTRTATTWTFTSGHVDPAAPQPPPLLSLDAALPLDRTNSARAGASMTFDVSGRIPDGLGPARVNSLALETSADGGTTWTAASKVTRVDRDTFSVTVANPAKAGPVALRITATVDGGGVRQEVIAAYAVN